MLCADIAQDKIIAFKAGFVLFSGGIAEHKAVMRHVSLQPAVGIRCRKRCGVVLHGDAQAALQVACAGRGHGGFCVFARHNLGGTCRDKALDFGVIKRFLLCIGHIAAGKLERDTVCLCGIAQCGECRHNAGIDRDAVKLGGLLGGEIRVRRVVFVDDEQIHAVLEHGQVVFFRACSGGRGGQYGGLRQGIRRIFGREKHRQTPHDEQCERHESGGADKQNARPTL